ncbi:hypothetical protein [Shewanella xiamenensis]|uniref:Uncharacterized protein n=1 Tax=Shewanella xiamenensis TaxID=332186 RepID=A0ABT6UGU5_9GAMM|nr:hypothetical protein [Shewanella xiamenensis]MDI5833692.1 hypothetical protein [Shewanella xiamenensis]
MRDTDEKDAFSEYCKTKLGMKANAVADYAQVPRRTFYDWWHTRRHAVDLIIDGILYRQKMKNER